MAVITRYDTDGITPIIAPQEGPQEMFCASTADIVFYGGMANGGKTFAELLEALRGVHDKYYTAVIFRRKFVEITQGGGLWDTSETIYPSMGGEAVKGSTLWRFPSGCEIKMTHLNNEDTKYDHQGGQYTLIEFDELTHFTESQFFYLMSRNRSPAGCTLKPYIRATFNAEPGWIADMIAWYWDPETGYPIPERSGVIRYFVRKNNKIIWVSKEYRDESGLPPKSFTYIMSSMEDNPLGMLANPDYKATINSLDNVTRERLGKGNFLIQEGGNMFKPEWFEVVDSAPAGIKLIRYWDFAATEVSEKDKNDPDWTAGALCGIWDHTLYIVDVIFHRETPGQTELTLINTASQDGRDVEIWWEEEKGSAGKFTSHYLRSVFKGYDAHPDPVSGQKVDRAKPWSAWAEFGRVKLVRGSWNRQFLSWASAFPDGKRDVIDAVSGAFKVLNGPDRVFKYYVSSPTGHFRSFPIDNDAFEKIDKIAVEIYGVLYANKIGQIFGAVYVYSLNSRKLRQYGEIISPEPISSRIAYEMQSKLVAPCYDKPEFASLKKIYCNDLMMDYGKGSIAKELKKYGLKLHLNLIYDEPGAIHTANNMMAENRFILHNSCKESDVQYRGMRYENKKIPDGNELARCGLILVSQLRAQMAREEVKIAPPYSKRKQNVRETLKSSGDLKHPDKKSEYEYMV